MRTTVARGPKGPPRRPDFKLTHYRVPRLVDTAGRTVTIAYVLRPSSAGWLAAGMPPQQILDRYLEPLPPRAAATQSSQAPVRFGEGVRPEDQPGPSLAGLLNRCEALAKAIATRVDQVHALHRRVVEKLEATSAAARAASAYLPPPTPRWDATTRQLTLGGQLLKRYSRPAENQEMVLAAFEEEHWPARLDDPLPPGRLADTVRGLNEAMEGRLRFRRDGHNQGLLWELPRISPASPLDARPAVPQNA